MLLRKLSPSSLRPLGNKLRSKKVNPIKAERYTRSRGSVAGSHIRSQRDTLGQPRRARCRLAQHHVNRATREAPSTRSTLPYPSLAFGLSPPSTLHMFLF